MLKPYLNMASNRSVVFSFIFIVILVIIEAQDFRIGSFNVQIFGQTKAKKPDVMDGLARIVQRYDIVLIQEIRDRKETAMDVLLELVNTLGPAEYDMVISERLGRSSSKEQYAFLYRWKAGIKVIDTYQWPDPKDVFEREPYAVKFQSMHTGLNEFVLAGVHIDPDVAEQEINSLVLVHGDIATHWTTDNIVIMGDFNADCSYLSKKKSRALLLRDAKYTWLIDDDADTTTKSTDCAYDRIIMTGESFIQHVVPNSAIVFHYDTEYGFNTTLTTAISDHYPIEFQLISSAHTGMSTSSSAYGLVSSWVSWVFSLIVRRAEL